MSWLSIRPALETITRRGALVCLRLIRSSTNSAGKPSRTLSRFSVLWPSITASESARCRNKCNLSSREVKSTGEKFRVVILPSTVMAKVALTNGREMWEGPLRRDLLFPGRLRDTRLRVATARRAEVPPAFLLRLFDFMFRRGHFALHFTQLNALRDAARFVEEIDDAAGRAADHDHEKAE